MVSETEPAPRVCRGCGCTDLGGELMAGRGSQLSPRTAATLARLLGAKGYRMTGQYLVGQLVVVTVEGREDLRRATVRDIKREIAALPDRRGVAPAQ